MIIVVSCVIQKWIKIKATILIKKNKLYNVHLGVIIVVTLCFQSRPIPNRITSTEYNAILKASVQMIYAFTISSHVTQVAQSIKRLCLLPGDPCSTTRVGIGTFFLANTSTIQRKIVSQSNRWIWYKLLQTNGSM